MAAARLSHWQRAVPFVWMIGICTAIAVSSVLLPRVASGLVHAMLAGVWVPLSILLGGVAGYYRERRVVYIGIPVALLAAHAHYVVIGLPPGPGPAGMVAGRVAQFLCVGLLVTMCVYVAAVTTAAFAEGLKWVPAGHCRKCGYNLTGNVSGRCPECGAPVRRKDKAE